MSLIKYTIYDTETQLPTRRGGVSEELLQSHIIDKLGPTEGVLIGVNANLKEDRVVVPANGATPYLRRRAQAEIDARQNRVRPPDQYEVLLEALRAQGIKLTDADLTAARDRLTGSARDKEK
jgi:hypothetical protein